MKGTRMKVNWATLWVLTAGMWAAGAVPSTNGMGEARNTSSTGDMAVLDVNPAGGATLRFAADADMEYELQWASSPMADDWRILESWMPGTNGEAAVAVELPESSGIFRIAARSTGEQGGGIFSFNAVGYATFTIPAGCLRIVSVPYRNLGNLDGRFRFGETELASQLPVGSVVYFWNEGNQKWGGGMKSAFGWDPAEANHVLMPGEGILVWNRSGENAVAVVSGAVPDEDSLSWSLQGGAAWYVMAWPYPEETSFDDSELASLLPRGSQVMFWNSDTQSWMVFTKRAGSLTTQHVLQVGEAFALQLGSDVTWMVEKPYDWP